MRFSHQSSVPPDLGVLFGNSGREFGLKHATHAKRQRHKFCTSIEKRVCARVLMDMEGVVCSSVGGVGSVRVSG